MPAIRHISRKVSRESLISRLPALFPFIEINPNGATKILPSTEAPDGCYGMVVPNVWPLTEEYESAFISIWTDKVKEKGVPYRVMLDKYYAMIRGDVEKNEKFIEFVDKYIGLTEVNLSDGFDWDKKYLTPRYIFLAQVESLYEEYKKMNILCNFYRKLVENNEKERDQTICCYCEKYELMGGDDMLDWLYNKIPIATSIANEALRLAVSIDLPTINFDVNLTSSTRDMGVVTPVIANWRKKEKYPVGTLVMYNDKLYKAVEDEDDDGWVNGSYWNEKDQLLYFNEKAFKLCSNNGCGLITDIEHSYDILNDTPFINGQPKEHYTNSNLVSCRRQVSYVNEIDEQEIPDTGEDWLFYYRIDQPVHIEYETDDYGNLLIDSDADGEDVQNYAENMVIIGDVITDILADSEKKTITFKYAIGTRLKIKGLTNSNAMSFIDIEIDDDGNKRYRLKNTTQFTAYKTDEEWNKASEDIDYGKYIEYGNRFEETYQYTDDETYELIKNSDSFHKFITGEYVGDKYAKYPFNTSSLMSPKDLHFGDRIVSRNIIMSKIKRFIDFRRPMSEIDGVPFLRYNYQLGIAYQPEVDADIFINRGTTSVFERHFKLAEVKSLEDMEDYANGGFFNMLDSNGN